MVSFLWIKCCSKILGNCYLSHTLKPVCVCVYSQPYMTCRQCSGYRKELSSVLWICEPSEEPAKLPGDGPSTSSDTTTGTFMLVQENPWSVWYQRTKLNNTRINTHSLVPCDVLHGFCCSSSGVQMSSSGQSPHLHLLLAAHARQTLWISATSDITPALWVALTPSINVLRQTELYFYCSFDLCRYGVSETLLSRVLGLSADWLSRLPGTLQRYVSDCWTLSLWPVLFIMTLFECFFTELNLTDKCLDGVLNSNHFESEVLKVCAVSLLFSCLIFFIINRVICRRYFSVKEACF